MAELNAHSERMVFIVYCKVKDTESFKTWTKDRAAKYVYDLKEENSISYEWHISEDGTEATLIEALSAWVATFHSHHGGYNREIVGPR